MIEYGVALFENTQGAVQAEEIAVEKGLEVKLIPVPREFSGNCGVAVRFGWEDLETLRETLSEAGVKVVGLHKMSGTG